MKKENKRIFITGGRGFIGSNLIKLLFTDSSYFVQNYDLANGDDIRDEFKLTKRINDFRPDIVIHMAARAGVGESKKFPHEYISTNISGTKNVITACEKNNTPLVFFSSSSVLGGNAIKSTDGEYLDLCESNVKYNPKSTYGITKMAGELLVQNSTITNKVIVRPFTVYGIGGRPDMVIYKVIDNIKKGEKSYFEYFNDIPNTIPLKRGYTYVKDLTEAMLVLLDKFFETGSFLSPVYHFSGREVISTYELRDMFSKLCEQHKIPFFWGTRKSASDNIYISFSNSNQASVDLNFSSNACSFEDSLNKIFKSELIK